MQFLKLISCSFQITNFISNVISFLCLVSFRLGFARYSHERNHDIQDDESWKVRWRFLWPCWGLVFTWVFLMEHKGNGGIFLRKTKHIIIVL